MTMLALIDGPLADAWGMHGDLGAGWWVVLAVGMVLLWAVVILDLVRLVRDGIQRWQQLTNRRRLSSRPPLRRGRALRRRIHQRRDVLMRERASRSNQGAGSRQSERAQP